MLRLRFVHTDEGTIDRTDWTPVDAPAALHTTNLMSTGRHHTVNAVGITNDALWGM